MKLKHIGIAIVMGACAIGGFLGARAYEQSQCAKLREADAQQKADDHAMLRAAAEHWADSIAVAQGESVLRSFAAGLTPLLLAEHRTAVDIAGASLLRLKGVQGVTVLRADGKVMYASDAKLTVAEEGNEQTRWALAAKDFTTRAGVQQGEMEMALPIQDGGKALAVVWLAFDTLGVRDQNRPESLKIAELSAETSSSSSVSAAVESQPQSN